jgi:hypothetical protein
MLRAVPDKHGARVHSHVYLKFIGAVLMWSIHPYSSVLQRGQRRPTPHTSLMFPFNFVHSVPPHGNPWPSLSCYPKGVCHQGSREKHLSVITRQQSLSLVASKMVTPRDVMKRYEATTLFGKLIPKSHTSSAHYDSLRRWQRRSFHADFFQDGLLGTSALRSLV